MVISLDEITTLHVRRGQFFNRLLKKSSLCAIFVLIGLITATPLFASIAHAQTTYSPGVKVGDSVTLGKIIAIWRNNSTPSPFIQQFNQTKSLEETVTNVNGKIVTATQTFNYLNGTSQTFTGSVDVQDGNGTLNVFILAGGLGAGDQIYQTPYPSFFPKRRGFPGTGYCRRRAGARPRCCSACWPIRRSPTRPC